MSGLYIHSASAFIGEADADANLLKEELRRYAREHFRRVNRFILLALIGARKCIHGRSVAADTAVYVTTEHGNLGDTATVLDEIYAAQSLPKPFSFINTMSNTAAFYLAQSLGARGRNITVSSQRLSFERGIDLLTADFTAGAEKSALIGGVDVASLSGAGGDEGALHPQRLHLHRQCWRGREPPQGGAPEVRPGEFPPGEPVHPACPHRRPPMHPRALRCHGYGRLSDDGAREPR